MTATKGLMVERKPPSLGDPGRQLVRLASPLTESKLFRFRAGLRIQGCARRHGPEFGYCPAVVPPRFGPSRLELSARGGAGTSRWARCGKLAPGSAC
jgi:hypothetical protein